MQDFAENSVEACIWFQAKSVYFLDPGRMAAPASLPNQAKPVAVTQVCGVRCSSISSVVHLEIQYEFKQQIGL